MYELKFRPLNAIDRARGDLEKTGENYVLKVNGVTEIFLNYDKHNNIDHRGIAIAKFIKKKGLKADHIRFKLMNIDGRESVKVLEDCKYYLKEENIL